jgi:hypothetical protein
VTGLASLDDVPAAHQALAEGRSAGKFVVATGWRGEAAVPGDGGGN